MKRLGHVVGSAEIEAVHLGLDVARAREEDDGNGRRCALCLEPPAQVEAAVLRHVDIEQDEIGLELHRLREPLLVRRRRDEADTLGLQPHREQREDLLRVVDGEHEGRVRSRRVHAALVEPEVVMRARARRHWLHTSASAWSIESPSRARALELRRGLRDGREAVASGRALDLMRDAAMLSRSLAACAVSRRAARPGKLPTKRSTSAPMSGSSAKSLMSGPPVCRARRCDARHLRGRRRREERRAVGGAVPGVPSDSAHQLASADGLREVVRCNRRRDSARGRQPWRGP